jgi:1-acyl-sn-glycerol-3-phosphate acyltransferase
MDRHIDWMSRIEFYGRWWSWLFLNNIGAFPVNRQGVAVSAIRTAIRRAAAGRVVGIFPEGGVTSGANSVCRGGNIKRGVCLVSYRANVPIIPCVVLGTHKLNAVRPWLPFRNARVWIAFGEPIWPDTALPPRPARQQLAQRFESACVNLCRELIETHKLADSAVP